MSVVNVKNLYGGFLLKKGDNDKRKVWAGKKHKVAADHVADLQKNLKAVGVFTSKVDGDFGKLMRDAIKRFKWNAKNIKRRLKNKSIVCSHKSFSGVINGLVDVNTKKELSAWKLKSHKATGDLIRIKELEFTNIQIGSGFKRIPHPCISDDDIVISSVLLEHLVQADEKAKELSVMLNFNNAMRVSGVRVSGTVVKPASKSQHLIGHAIDCNIIDGNSWNNKKTFKANKETKNARKFIKAMKANGMRWGGDFKGKNKFDPPHFDKNLNAYSKDFEYKYFFNQRVVTEKHVIPLVSW